MKQQLKNLTHDPYTLGPAMFIAGFGVGYVVHNLRIKKMLANLEVTETFVEETIIDVEIEAGEEESDFDTKEYLAAGFARAIEEASERHPSNASIFGDVGTIVERTEKTALEKLQVDVPMEDVQRLVLVPKSNLTVADDGTLTVTADPEPEMTGYDDIEWDQEVEEENRSADAPYVIHLEEWHSNESNFSQEDLVYYAGDDILCDAAQNTPVYNPGPVVGDLEFGRGSGNSEVVFVRNEALRAEYQITRVSDSYQTVMFGIEAEEAAEAEDLRHSAQIRRFRSVD